MLPLMVASFHSQNIHLTHLSNCYIIIMPFSDTYRRLNRLGIKNVFTPKGTNVSLGNKRQWIMGKGVVMPVFTEINKVIAFLTLKTKSTAFICRTLFILGDLIYCSVLCRRRNVIIKYFFALWKEVVLWYILLFFISIAFL